LIGLASFNVGIQRGNKLDSGGEEEAKGGDSGGLRVTGLFV